MTLSAFATLTRRAAWAGLVVLCLALLVLGCSTTRTVTVPAQETTINAELPDTSQKAMLPPPEPIGQVTRPENVVVYRDTATYDVDLSFLEVDRSEGEQTVTVRTQEGGEATEKTYPLPAYGEGLRLQADSQGLQGTVFGVPVERQVEATDVEVPWWEKAKTQLRLVIAFAGGIVFGIFGAKLFL
jgi:hypothetical protein